MRKHRLYVIMCDMGNEIKKDKEKSFMKRRNKGLMLLVTLLLITLFSTTVFAADEAEYVPKLFGTFLGVDTATCGNCTCIDYKGSL